MKQKVINCVTVYSCSNSWSQKQHVKFGPG